MRPMIQTLTNSLKSHRSPAKSASSVSVSASVAFFRGLKMKTFEIMAIPLSQGLFALVDGKDFERLSRHKWYAHKHRKTYYAGRDIVKHKSRQQILMHREILGLTRGDGKITDHVNRCGLDNREANIRVCTNSQNSYNRISNVNNKSGYKGVHQIKTGGKWRALIGYNGIQLHLGYFDIKEDAARAYDKAALAMYGEFANLNNVK